MEAYGLLRGIQDHADYAAEAGELDAEDIPHESIERGRIYLASKGDGSI